MCKISLNQINFTVGALVENTKKLLSWYKKDCEVVDLSIFPELGIVGYPPEDLLYSSAFIKDIEFYQKKIIASTKNKNAALLFGTITKKGEKLYNTVYFVQNGILQNIIYKNSLPNYGVFDEKRYFAAENTHQTITLNDKSFLVLICEDLWQENLAEKIAYLTFSEVIILNASPYNTAKLQKRLNLVRRFNKKVYYLNLIGGQDSLVFDGNSFVINENGELVKLLASFQEAKELVNDSESQVKLPEDLAQDYQALMLGLSDYVQKNNFKEVLIALSGGADSALVSVIACDALGVDKVHLVTMPSQYTSKESFTDADLLIKQLNCASVRRINIEEINSSFLHNLAPFFKGRKSDLTEENLQARIRGVLLMSLANKFGFLVLATSNKSETAVGYATLYGDMCGAYSVIKDIYKTKIYELIKWRNKNIPVTSLHKVANPVAQNIIDKAPTAELRANQQDTDSLPEYRDLDQILYYLIEEKKSINEIVSYGFAKEIVVKIYKLLKNSEYKRYQAAVGPKISALSFDKERRIPLTNHYENL